MLSCQQHLFSLDPQIRYINCATMSPNLISVENAGMVGIMKKSQPHLITQDTFFESTVAVKARFASLINCPDSERIALIPSVSYGMAVVAENLKRKANLRCGQEILLVQDEFPSNVYAWEEVSKEKGLIVRTIAAPDSFENRGEVWNKVFLEAITSNTCLVVISPVHWTDGTKFNLDQIAEACHQHVAWLVVDGTQSNGAMGFDVEKIKPDAVINAGYKWLLGPYSSGVAYFGPAFDDGVPIERNWINRRDSEEFRNLVNYQTSFRQKADRFNVGERSNFILNPMLASALQQLLDWGVSAIEAYCKHLMKNPLETLQSHGFWVEDPLFRASHLVGIRIPKNAKMHRIQDELKKRDVVVAIRGEAIRVSPHVYNTQADLDLFVEALLSALKPS
jgi:selenocysteine lyase/cysteine desulfurase